MRRSLLPALLPVRCSRLVLLPTVALVGTVAVGCGSADESAIETLPTIHTTTTTTTTTTTPDSRRQFYKVQAGDNLAEIARSFEVPRAALVELNDLPEDGSYLAVGQILEIPTDVVLLEELPTPASSTTLEP